MKRLFASCLIAVGLLCLCRLGSAQDKPPQPEKAPRLIEGILTIIDLVPQSGDNGKFGKPLAVLAGQEFTDTAAKVEPKLAKLLADGSAISIRRSEFTVLEGRKTLISSIAKEIQATTNKAGMDASNPCSPQIALLMFARVNDKNVQANEK